MSDYLDATATTEPSEIPLAIPAKCMFFPVSLFKLTVMSLFTLGLYEIYWFYRNWQLIKAHESLRILPFARAFFTILFCYQCFVRVRRADLRLGITPPLSAGLMAVGWIAVYFIGALPDPYWILSLLNIFFLLPVQRHINHINALQTPLHDTNVHFGTWNRITIIVGAILLIFTVLESFSPDTGEIEAGPLIQVDVRQNEMA